MKKLFYMLCFMSTASYSQEYVTAELVSTIPLKAEQLIGLNNFGTLFYINGPNFYKIEPQQSFNYSNVQLGNITSADAFNPLKITLFYKNFNTVLILDNRLAEIYQFNFSIQQPYRNVTHVSAGNDTTLWIYNQDLQQLELFDYKKNKTRANTMPVRSDILALVSTLNDAWLLTENHLYKYNYFGSTLLKMKNQGFLNISENNGNLVVQTKDQLYYLAKNSEQLIPIHLPSLLIKQFLLTNESLYIYTDETLHQFQLKIN